MAKEISLGKGRLRKVHVFVTCLAEMRHDTCPILDGKMPYGIIEVVYSHLELVHKMYYTLTMSRYVPKDPLVF